jgi:Ca2+-binding EF-hand superfamily protein
MKILNTISLATLCLCFLAPLDAQKKGAKKGKRDRVAATLKRHDGNKNGSIEKDEAKGRIGKAFAKIDTNDDGKIEKDELAKYMAAQQSKRSKRAGKKGKKGEEKKGGEKKKGRKKKGAEKKGVEKKGSNEIVMSNVSLELAKVP